MRLLKDLCDAKMLSNDALSFVGDAVYSLLVRERLCCDGNCRSGLLHKLSADHVKAPAQAKAYKAIESMLTEKEMSVYKRGRNAHNNNTPKGSTEGEYHSAPGLAALFGYLYMAGETDRINQLFDCIWQQESQ